MGESGYQLPIYERINYMDNIANSIPGQNVISDTLINFILMKTSYEGFEWQRVDVREITYD